MKHRNGARASPGLDGVSCGHRELASGTAEGLPGSPTEAAPPLRQLQVLRRSLSWPEDLSMRDTAERGKMDSFPGEAAVVPRDCFGLAEPEQPGAEVTEVGVPTACAALGDSDTAAHLENECCDTPNSLCSSKPELPDDHNAWTDTFRHLSKVPQSSLKRFTLNFQRMPLQPNEGPNKARLRRKGGRRFGRSLSHESGLPLRAEEEAGCAAKQKGATLLPPKSPLQSFKAYGRQIFLSHKHWAMAFAGLRTRKQAASSSPQESKRTTTDSQEPVSGCWPEGEQRRYHRAPKFPLVEPQLVAAQGSLDL